MKITWIGHSCFRIEGDGHAIIIDPYSDGSVPGLDDVRENADMVLCTHEHGDHNFRESVHLSGKDSPFTIESIGTFHDDAEGTKRGKNTILIISDGKTRIAHLGDLGCRPREMEKLRGIDVMLIPVGGFYTINGKEAANLVRALSPKIVVPMHYRSDEKGFGYDVISTVDDFVSEFRDVHRTGKSSIDTEDEKLSGVVILTPSNTAER